jgi:hypothetical protein
MAGSRELNNITPLIYGNASARAFTVILIELDVRKGYVVGEDPARSRIALLSDGGRHECTICISFSTFDSVYTPEFDDADGSYDSRSSTSGLEVTILRKTGFH